MINHEMIQLNRVTDSLEISQELRTIYEEAFPSDERRDWAQFTELLNNPNFFLKAICYKKKLIGMLTIWNLHDFSFIEHFAIQDDERGKGFGTQVINQLLAGTSIPLILEVEESITETAQKRIRFYERFKFSVCKCEYFQPALSIDKNMVKMLLMSYPEEINEEYFPQIKAGIYSTVYDIVK